MMILIIEWLICYTDSLLNNWCIGHGALEVLYRIQIWVLKYLQNSKYQDI